MITKLNLVKSFIHEKKTAQIDVQRDMAFSCQSQSKDTKLDVAQPS